METETPEQIFAEEILEDSTVENCSIQAGPDISESESNTSLLDTKLSEDVELTSASLDGSCENLPIIPENEIIENIMMENDQPQSLLTKIQEIQNSDVNQIEDAKKKVSNQSVVIPDNSIAAEFHQVNSGKIATIEETSVLPVDNEEINGVGNLGEIQTNDAYQMDVENNDIEEMEIMETHLSETQVIMHFKYNNYLISFHRCIICPTPYL